MADTKLNLDMEGDEELVFQNIPHDSREKSSVKDGVHTHTFTNFPEPAESDDDTDKADLLSGDKKQPSFWTFEYYQTFFDVDTYQVLRRSLGSMYPNPRINYLQSQIRPNPDMYGPFWICTTLVFTTAIAGNMANYIQYGGKDYQWRYDFHKVTFAASAIFAYWWIVPTLLYMLLWKRGSQAGYTFLEIICVYGYSLAIYIPISILWVIQVSWFQWVLVLLGMVLSGSVLVLTFWPAVRNDDKKVAWLTMAGILLFHGLLAAGFVLYFFHVPVYAAAVINNNNGTVLATAGPTTVLNRIAAAPTTLSPSGINQLNVQHPLNSMVPSAGGGHQIAPQGPQQAFPGGGANSAQHYGNQGQVPGPHFPPPGSANQIPVHPQPNQLVGNNNQRLTNNAGIGQVPQNQFQGQQRS